MNYFFRVSYPTLVSFSFHCIQVFILCWSGTESERQPVESGSDRLEEMKTELNQTKLELESALQSQHKHLKELDTLR